MHLSLLIGLGSLAFIDGIGGPEILLVMFIALVLFGGKSLPSFARTVGKSVREFKKATGEVEKEIRRAIDEEPEQPAQPVYAPPAVSPLPPQQAAASPAASPALATTEPAYSPYPELAPTQTQQVPALPQPLAVAPASPDMAKPPLPPSPAAGEPKV